MAVQRRGKVSEIYITKSYCCVSFYAADNSRFYAFLWSYMAQPETDNPAGHLLQDRYLALTRDAYLNNKTVEVEYPEITTNMINSIRIS